LFGSLCDQFVHSTIGGDLDDPVFDGDKHYGLRTGKLIQNIFYYNQNRGPLSD